MSKQIEIIKSTRKFVLEYVSGLGTEQLNEVPKGFSNNIIWHIGHLVATQQGMCYVRSGNKMFIDDRLFQTYKPGTKPEAFVDASEIAAIKGLMIAAIDQLEVDYANKIFVNFDAVTTRYGVTISGIDDALSFLGFHEGLHIGYIMALKKAV